MDLDINIDVYCPYYKDMQVMALNSIAVIFSYIGYTPRSTFNFSINLTLKNIGRSLRFPGIAVRYNVVLSDVHNV